MLDTWGPTPENLLRHEHHPLLWWSFAPVVKETSLIWPRLLLLEWCPLHWAARTPHSPGSFTPAAAFTQQPPSPHAVPVTLVPLRARYLDLPTSLRSQKESSRLMTLQPEPLPTQHPHPHVSSLTCPKQNPTPSPAPPSLLITAAQTRPSFICSEKNALESFLTPFLLSHLGFHPPLVPASTYVQNPATYSHLHCHHAGSPGLLQRSLLTGLTASAFTSIQQPQWRLYSMCQIFVTFMLKWCRLKAEVLSVT